MKTRADFFLTNFVPDGGTFLNALNLIKHQIFFDKTQISAKLESGATFPI
jgi:hypothetical protein